ncbi:hypothetical protein Sme01_19470 [Sphaerisporangium melleum]|uniref:Uncharacterized protein n=2 Tax=Sphaerisporangium melleum TaxID=321316 RepID=A0A917VNV0_9ACTN|nr:hypothetical protein GCM10007964_51170 [Sphaerisporangium melleum]GII69471.1 hypothetical protein Sme01_19470 [Sphaerisporangium melleum]
MVIVATSLCMVAACTTSPPTPAPDESSAGWQPVPQAVPDDDEEDEEGFIEICVTKNTRVRVGYRGCDDARPGVTWYFLPMDARVPAVGSTAKRGSVKKPQTDEILRAPAKGGKGEDVGIADVEDRVEVCVVRTTRIRVSDSRCEHHRKGYGWYYIRIDGRVPAVGKQAEGGSFRKPYAEAYRARRKGGDAARAAIDYEDPDEEEEEEEYCTTTIDGECVATNRCTQTLDGVCTDSGDNSSEPRRTCSQVFVNKHWTRHCRP